MVSSKLHLNNIIHSFHTIFLFCNSSWKSDKSYEYSMIYLLIFSFQVQALKVLVNLSSNPDMMDDIVQAQVRVKEI